MIKERKFCPFEYMLYVPSSLKMLDTPNKSIMPNEKHGLKNKSGRVSLFEWHSIFHKVSQNYPKSSRFINLNK